MPTQEEMLSSYVQLVDNMKKCSLCALRFSCTQVVPGSGSPEAEILFIGEGPGKNEDEQGVPFVGSAGKFLDEMLGNIGLKRSDVYIANAVKCRPPQNRDPLPEEIASCRPWLMSQIDLIQPKLLVTLGRHSMGMFLPNLKISTSHGHAYRTKVPELERDLIILTLYHPAAALYNGGMRTTLLSDFKKIPALIKKIRLQNGGDIPNQTGL